MSREAILPASDFRFPAPGSQAEYKLPLIAETPEQFHYYHRDGRRNITPTTVIENPTRGLALTATPGKSTLPVQFPPMKPRPPSTNDNMKLQPSPHQPPSDGYFPIVNFS